MSSRKSETAETMLEEMAAHNPEEGWDDNTPQQGTVLDFATRQEVERRQSFPPSLPPDTAGLN
jgi:hypothetical protein